MLLSSLTKFVCLEACIFIRVCAYACVEDLCSYVLFLCTV